MDTFWNIISTIGGWWIYIIFLVAFCISFHYVKKRVAREKKGKRSEDLPASVRDPYGGTRRLIASTLNRLYGSAGGGAEELYSAIEKGANSEADDNSNLSGETIEGESVKDNRENISKK